jgi:hypothetical protein
VQIVQRLTSTLHGARRVSDLPGTFNVVRRAGAWLVCPAGVER